MAVGHLRISFPYRMIILLVLLPALVAEASDQIEQVSVYRSLSVSGTLANGTQFTLIIELSPYNCSEIRRNDKTEYWGIDRACPDTTIKKLELYVDNKLVVIPKSAYSDLADVTLPSGVYVMQLGTEVRLYVRGGDGVASYTALILIVGGKAVSRSIEYLNSEGNLVTSVKRLK